MLPRCDHSITAISLTPRLIEVTMFGGSSHYNPTLSDKEIPKLAATCVLMFGKISLHVLCKYVFILPNLEFVDITWVLVGVADNSQLGSAERIQKKIEKIKQFAREAKQVPTDDDGDLPEREGELLQQLERERQEAQQVQVRAEAINNTTINTSCNYVHN